MSPCANADCRGCSEARTTRAAALRQRFRFGERRHACSTPEINAMAGGNADERATAFGGLPRGGERGLERIDRALTLPRLDLQATAQHVERDTSSGSLARLAPRSASASARSGCNAAACASAASR
jgi:hypothetical protein